MSALSYYAATTATGFTEAVGWIGVVFFGLGTVPILSWLFRSGPTVVIDDTGVFDRRWGVGRIAWEDIASVSITQVRRQRFISLWLRNQNEYLGRISTMGASLSRMSEKIGFSPFSMNFSGLTPGLDEAYARLRERLPERVRC
jgi:hypothetical protein